MTKFPHELQPGHQEPNSDEPSASPEQGAASYAQQANGEPPATEPSTATADESPITGEDLRQAAGFSDQPVGTGPTDSAEPSLQAKLAEREDQLIRLAAEVENMRKRHAQELANASKFAIEGFAEALLPVADSLEMALLVQEQSYEGLKSGVEVTLRQMQQAFDRGRLSTLNPAGEKFDPNRHQAVSMVDGQTQDPPVPSGHVVSVMQKGYLIGDRVLRPALVAVAQ